VKTTAEGVEQWFTPARFGLLTACLIAACFPGVIAGRDTFFFRDFAIFSYPLAAYHKECFWQGTIPLWNPYNDCGLPFLAQWNTMVLYPLSLIYLLFPLSWSLPIFCLFHWWLGGFGMYRLARSWTGSNSAATLAGLAFLFNGVLLSCLKWPNNIAALGWMPWVVLTAERAFSGNARALGIAALVGAIQMLAGAPEIILLTWGFVAAFWLTSISGEWRKPLLRFPLLVLLVAGLSAAQLLPFLDLLQHSQRDGAFRGSQWPIPPWGWANFILPLFYMFPSYHDVHAQPGQYWISTYYVAIGVLLLAIIGIIKVRNRKVWLLGGLLLFSMWMALGERALLYKWLRSTVPGLGMMRFPVKFIVLAGFVLPLLGAIGFKHLLQNPPKRRAIWIPAITLAVAIAALIIYAELNPFRYSRAFLTTTNGLWRIVCLVASAGLLAVLPRKPLAPFLMALIVADGLTHTTWQNPVAPSWVYDGSAAQMQPFPRLGEGRAMISPEAAETVDHLKLDKPADDVMASRISLYCNLNLLDHIPKIDGFYAIYPREMSRLQDRLYKGTNVPPATILDFLGVTQITAPGSWEKWQHRSAALPLITSPRNACVIADPLVRFLGGDFDPREEAFVASPIAINGIARVESVDWTAQKIGFNASADATALVVLSQTFYHHWNATIDGQPAEIIKVNGAFQGLTVPAGSHRITLQYRDASFRLGLILSFITGAVVAILFLVCRPKPQ
jgi:hypothetical protein